MSSNVSTPILEPHGLSHGLPGPSPLGRTLTSAKRPASPQRQPADLDDIPPLSLDVLSSRNDKVGALKLIADSIAQQRQRAAASLIFHPLLVSGLALALAITYQVAWARRAAADRDFALAMTLAAGVVMAYLLAARFAAHGYIQLAEDLRYDFLRAPDAGGDEDIVIGARFGSELIGACVLRLEPALPGSPRKRNNRSHHHQTLRGGKGVIRAWTVRLRYRGRGVGQDLLHEAVRITRERCGREAEVGFAAEHANSEMVLPEMFNRTFRKGERRAAGALERVLGEWEGIRRKR